MINNEILLGLNWIDHFNVLNTLVLLNIAVPKKLLNSIDIT